MANTVCIYLNSWEMIGLQVPVSHSPIFNCLFFCSLHPQVYIFSTPISQMAGVWSGRETASEQNIESPIFIFLAILGSEDAFPSLMLRMNTLNTSRIASSRPYKVTPGQLCVHSKHVSDQEQDQENVWKHTALTRDFQRTPHCFTIVTN